MSSRIDRETLFARAVLIAEKHPDVSCIYVAYRHLHEKECAEVDAPDVSIPPHGRN